MPDLQKNLDQLQAEIGRALTDVKVQPEAKVIRPDFSHESNHQVLKFGPVAADAIKQAALETSKRALAAGEEAMARAKAFQEDCQHFSEAVISEANLRAEAVALFGEQMASMASNLTATRDLLFPPSPSTPERVDDKPA